MSELEKLNSTLMEKKSGSHSSQDRSNAQFWSVIKNKKNKVIISKTGEYTQRIIQLEKFSSVDLKFLNPSPEQG
jgi:hypothetical protein